VICKQLSTIMLKGSTIPTDLVHDFSSAQETLVKETKGRAKAQGRNAVSMVQPLPRKTGSQGRTCKIIAVYNFKGGVGKTTTSINLGAALADAGYKTVIVDADPQCNLTSFFQPPVSTDETASPSAEAEVQDLPAPQVASVVGAGPPPIDMYELSDKAETAIMMDYMKQVDTRMHNSGIYDIDTLLAPAFEGNFAGLEPPEKLLGVAGVPNLMIVPGNPCLTKREGSLNLVEAQQATASVYLGAFRKLFIDISQVSEADYILVDLSPSMSTLNKTILLSCDYILPPVFPDFFSLSSMQTFLKEMVPLLMEDHEKIMDAQPKRLTAPQKLYGYGFNPSFPKILPFLVSNFNFQENRIERGAANWVVSMRELVDPTNEFVPLAVLDLCIKSGDAIVVPFTPNYNKLTKWAHEWGHPPILMDEKYFNDNVRSHPSEKTSTGQKPPLHWFKGQGYDKAACIKKRYESLVRFIVALPGN